MTAVWVLDTDHLSLFQREHPIVTQRLNQINFVNTAITVVTLEEQMKGWLNVINKYNDQPDQSEKLILAYKGLRDGVQYLNKLKLLDFDRSKSKVQAPKFIYGKRKKCISRHVVQEILRPQLGP